jgi:hypothetical protein
MGLFSYAADWREGKILGLPEGLLGKDKRVHIILLGS